MTSITRRFCLLQNTLTNNGWTFFIKAWRWRDQIKRYITCKAQCHALSPISTNILSTVINRIKRMSTKRLLLHHGALFLHVVFSHALLQLFKRGQVRRSCPSWSHSLHFRLHRALRISTISNSEGSLLMLDAAIAPWGRPLVRTTIGLRTDVPPLQSCESMATSPSKRRRWCDGSISCWFAS